MSTTDQITRDEVIITDYQAKLESGQAFSNCAASARSAIGYRPPAEWRQYVAALDVLVKGAHLGERQAALIEPVLRALPNANGPTPGQAVAAMYEAATRTLASHFFDIGKAASPEPGRRSDNEQPWTLHDRIALAVTLHFAARCYEASTGIGWCLAALVERERVRVLANPEAKR